MSQVDPVSLSGSGAFPSHSCTDLIQGYTAEHKHRQLYVQEGREELQSLLVHSVLTLTNLKQAVQVMEGLSCSPLNMSIKKENFEILCLETE